MIASLRQALPDSHIDCHLMVSDPQKWLEPLRKAGASSFTFHLESPVMPPGGPLELIRLIKAAGLNAGMVIKPDTPVGDLYQYAPHLDLVLLMTVEPGFSGQAFMPHVMPKVQALRRRFPDLDIQVDGGLSPDTVDQAASAGANAIVAASAIFGSSDRKGVLAALRASVDRYRKE